MTGTPVRAGGRGDFMEHFRIGSDGQIADTQHELVSQEEAEEQRNEPQTQWITSEDNSWFGQRALGPAGPRGA